MAPGLRLALLVRSQPLLSVHLTWQLEGLTVEEIGQKWSPEIMELIMAPGGPFENANKTRKL